MRTLCVIALAAIGLAAASAAEAKDWKTVKIATEGAFAPWNFVEGGKLNGFDVELAGELCKRMQVTCEVTAQDWDGIIPGLQAGKYDAIMAAMISTPKRRDVVDFSQSYANGPHGFAVQKGGPLASLPDANVIFSLEKEPEKSQASIDKMRALFKGKVLGAQTSTTNLAFMEKFFGDIATVRGYKTTEQHDLDLLAGRVDVIMYNVTAIRATIEKPGFEALTIAGPAFTDVFGERGACVALRKADPDLRAMFDKAISSAIADGTLKKLSVKWFKIDITPAPSS